MAGNYLAGALLAEILTGRSIPTDSNLNGGLNPNMAKTLRQTANTYGNMDNWKFPNPNTSTGGAAPCPKCINANA